MGMSATNVTVDYNETFLMFLIGQSPMAALGFHLINIWRVQFKSYSLTSEY